MMEFSIFDKTPYTTEQITYLDNLLGKIVFPWVEFENGLIAIYQHEHDWTISSLFIDGACYMTNSAPDLLDHRKILEDAEGDVLLTGYGLGLGVIFANMNHKVNTITVIENNSVIIETIGPMVNSVYNRIMTEVLCADADAWIPSKSYDFAFIDHGYQRANAERYAPFCNTLVSWWDERQNLEKLWR